MTRRPGQDWDELRLSEDPAVEVLSKHLGYVYVAPEVLEAERASLYETVLVGRLGKALKKLNPWISDDNLHKAVRAVTNVQAASLIEAGEKLHTLLAYGTALEQDRGEGKRSHNVRFLDFEKPERNEFLVTRQYRLQGAKTQIIPDLVVFVNGIPLGVIECKSPTLGDKWKTEAIEQLHRYQELGDHYRERGMPRLFETVQVVVGTCGQAAVYGTVGTPPRFFAEWKSVYPRTDPAVEAALGRTPTPQDILLFGLLDPHNILDILRNFVVFENDASVGRKIRKLCRYQQYTAVNKAIDRARKARKPTERGGVVWHTQGSGKSLTMLWLALKLRRDQLHENPTLVIVTDRVDLDEQIRETFQACNFPNPERAESVRDLQRLLSGPGGITILTTVHKFQDSARGKGSARAVYPTLSEAKNIFILADEAHRTQYGNLAANMRKALPNAAFFGFTGTPIDKKDRSTLHTFGPYIDTYTIEQAVADGATVPIFYEGRLPELRIVGNNLDAVFDRVFADRTAEEREAIKKRYAREDAIAAAPKRIDAICLDLIDHYTKFIQPNGYKAQIVAVSRDAAALYKETLDRFNAPESAVVYSSSNDDKAHLAKYRTDKEQRDKLIDRFKRPMDKDGLSILIVCDMLITGFDAPIEQVMYLDSPLKEHTLLQAIARVNRIYDDAKTYGLIVDYWGVSEALEEALEIFAPADIRGVMLPKADELPRLQSRHQAALRFFVRIKHRDDLNECIAVIAADDTRAEFDLAFRRFGQSLDMLLPDPRALHYVADFKWLGKIRQGAAARFRDKTVDISDCGPKVRKLIEDAIIAEGIQILVKQVSLFSADFEEKLKALRSDEARASEMEHAIRDEIHLRLDENPAFYASLRARLEQILADCKARRIDAAEQLRLLAEVRTAARGPRQAAEKLGLSETAFAIYGLLSPKARADDKPDQAAVDLAAILEETLEAQTDIVDWQHKEEVQKEMRKRIKRQLSVAQYAADKADALAVQLVELLKNRHGRS
jgi:type I restriction enzyme R subunit